MRLILSATLALCALEAATAQTTSNSSLYSPSVFFNLTLPATFPWLQFEPNGYAPLSSNDTAETRWELSYTQNPTGDYVPGMMGVGTATMTSSRANGSINGTALERQSVYLVLEYSGNGFWVHGSFDGQSDDPYAKVATGDDPLRLINLATEADPGFPADDLLLGVSQQAFGLSRMHLVNNNGTLAVTGVTLTTGIVTEAPTFDDVNITVVPFVTEDNEANPAFRYTKLYSLKTGSRWPVSETIGGVNGQPVIPYKTLRTTPPEDINTTMTFGSTTLSIQIPVPINTSFAMLNGTIGPDHGLFDVSVKPVPLANGSPIELRGNCTSKWVSAGILWFSPLDPKVQYNITLYPRDNNSTIHGFHSMTYYSGVWYVDTSYETDSARSGNSSLDDMGSGPAYAPHRKKVNAGAIAGGVVGGLAGIVIMAALGWVCFTKRASQNAERAEWEVAPGSIVTPEMSSVITDSQSSAPTGPAPLPQAPESEAMSSGQPDEEEEEDDVELLPPTYKPNWSLAR